MYGYSAHAEGGTNKVTGHYAHAEGTNNTVSGESAHAEGHENTVDTKYAHAEGTNNTINKNAVGSHAEGDGNTVNGFSAHAEGKNNKALSDNTHVEGGSNTASGSAAHAEGSNTIASGLNSHAQNANTTASGNNSTAIGYKTVAQSEESFAGGVETVVKGNYSFAFGSKNLIDSNAQNSVAFGIYNTINNSHNDSTVFGYGNKTGAGGQFILGRYADSISIVDKNPIFLIGNGSSNESRSNAFTVYKDGYAEVQTQGTTDNSVVIKSKLDEMLQGKEDSITYKTHLTVGSITTDPDGGGKNISKLENTSLNFIDKAASTTLASMMLTPTAHSGTTPAYLTLSSPAQSTDVGHTDVRLTGIAAPIDDTDAVNKISLYDGLAGKEDKITSSTNLIAGTVTAEAGNYLLKINNQSIDFVDRLISSDHPSISITMSGYKAGSSVTPADVSFLCYPQLTTALQNPYVTLSNIANPTSNYQAANKKYVDDIKTELLNAINHPYTYDETTKELTLIL